MRERHGMTNSPEHIAWANMINRCTLPACINFHRYGGRGIKVCDRWRFSFPNFFADVGLKPNRLHSLERINNNGHYEPGNIRWATRKEQQQNTRRNLYWTHDGETLCASEWARRIGIDTGTMGDRIRRSLPPEEMLKPSLRKPKHMQGIYFNKRMQKWQLRIKDKHIGTFLTEQEAVAAKTEKETANVG